MKYSYGIICKLNFQVINKIKLIIDSISESRLLLKFLGKIKYGGIKKIN